MGTNDTTDRRLEEFSTWPRVQFRCMIQDILGNEIYRERDTENLGDRTIFYCITIPGENEWVRQRSSNGFEQFDKLKKNENETVSSDDERLSCSLVNYSYPLPSDGKNRSCLIKVYDLSLIELLRVNDIVQVDGFVEPSEFDDDAELLTNKSSPVMNGTNDEPGNPNNVHSSGDNNDANNATNHPSLKIDHGFEPANDFPHRLVPRVHVKSLKKLTHLNPLLPDTIKRDSVDFTRLRLARARLSTILTQLFGGDSLVAEYLIMFLIAKIQSRKGDMSLGQIPINITGIKPELKPLVDKLYNFISKITTHSHLIDLSIANLNNLQFTPQKDHDNNKMIAGTLQLPDGMLLLINETALSEGLLNQRGTANLSTLNHIITWQKHQYDFKFHSFEIDTDLNILVLSEGKSLLTSIPIILKLEYDSVDSIKQACESLDSFLDDELLNMFRYFISALRQGDSQGYLIPTDVAETIQADYVKFRQSNAHDKKTLFSPDDLSNHMTLARLLTLSRGESTLTKDLWNDVCRLEANRVGRLVK